MSVDIDALPDTRVTIVAQAREDMVNILGAQAAKHEHGAGLEQGIPDLTPFRRAKRYLAKNGSYAAASALEYVAAGHYRDSSEGDGGKCSECIRYGKRVAADRLHELYFCYDNRTITDPLFLNSFKYRFDASKGLDSEAVFWLRGIVPANRRSGTVGPDILSAKVWSTSNFDSVFNRSGMGYSDGTRGQADVPESLREAAVGASCSELDCSIGVPRPINIQGMGGAVLGLQTVPRAELWGHQCTEQFSLQHYRANRHRRLVRHEGRA